MSCEGWTHIIVLKNPLITENSCAGPGLRQEQEQPSDLCVIIFVFLFKFLVEFLREALVEFLFEFLSGAFPSSSSPSVPSSWLRRFSPSSSSLRLRRCHPRGSAGSRQDLQVPHLRLRPHQGLFCPRRICQASPLRHRPLWNLCPSFLIIYKITIMICGIDALLASGGAGRPQ